MAFAPPSRNRMQYSKALPQFVRRGNYAGSLPLERSLTEPTRKSYQDKSLANKSPPIQSFSSTKKCELSSEKNESSDEGGSQLLRDQIALSKLVWEKKKCLTKTAVELARDIETIKRAEDESRRLAEKEYLFHQKRANAMNLRASSLDASVRAKQELEVEVKSNKIRAQQEREAHRHSVFQAKMHQAVGVKRRSETMKTEMFSHSLRIDRERIIAAAEKAAHAHVLREERESLKESLRKDKLVQLNNARIHHENNKQAVFAQSIEDTMRLIKQMAMEKKALEEALEISSRRDSIASPLHSSHSSPLTQRRSTGSSRISQLSPYPKGSIKSESALSRSYPNQDSDDQITVRALSKSYPASMRRSTPRKDSHPLARSESVRGGRSTDWLMEERPRSRSCSSDRFLRETTFHSSTSSSEAKRTPRSESTRRVRNRYGNWEHGPEKVERDTTPRPVDIPDAVPEPLTFAPIKIEEPPVPLSVTRAGPSFSEAEPSFSEYLPPEHRQVDTGASPQTDIHTVECHQDNPGNVIFLPLQNSDGPQCFLASSGNPEECLFYETPSLQANAAGQIRQVPLSRVVE